MTCLHKELLLIKTSKQRLRCSRCYLTISADELNNSYCPECFERSKVKNYDFDTCDSDSKKQSYRCEACGLIIK